MDDIASEAELSKGTLYLYFKSKDELFLAISNVKLREVRERFGAILAGEQVGLEKLRSMLHAYADLALSDPEMFRIAAMWIGSGKSIDTETAAFCRHRDCIEGVITQLVQVIDEGREDGSIRLDTDGMPLAGQIWGGMLGTLLVRINAEELQRRMPAMRHFEQLIPGFVRLVCDGLRATGGQS